MSISPSLVSVALLASVLLATAVGYAVWQYRPRRGATWLAVTTLGFVPWSLGIAAAGASAPATAVPWLVVAQAGVATVTLGWFLFAVGYTGRDGWLTRPRLVAIWSLPAAYVLLAAAGPANLVFVDVRTTADGTLAFGWGIAALGFFAYKYAFWAVAEVLLAAKAVRSRNVYRRRTAMFVLIGAVIGGAHAVDIAAVGPVPRETLSPLLFLGVGVASFVVIYDHNALKLLPVDRLFALFGSRFTDLTPLARDFVIEEMGSGVVVIDGDDRVVDINPVAREMLSAGRIVGNRIGDVLDPDAYVGDGPAFLDADVTEGRFTDVWTDPPDGDRRCYDVVLTPIPKRGGEPGGRVAIVHDVTDRQRRKRHLERQALELERQNVHLEEFAGVVSHDLRNPLTVAQGNVELVLETGETDRLERAQRAHQRMDDIIEDVLTLARQGRSLDEQRPVALAEMARDAWRNVDTGTATLEVAVDEETTVTADGTRLKQVFENLFRNAVEHGAANPASPVERDANGHAGGDAAPAAGEDGRADSLTVTVGEFADGFYVADDGRGIPPDQRRSVLEEGYSTSKRGTGLGLAIVKTVVDAHGWSVHVGESEDGGARFDVRGGQLESPARNDAVSNG